jgi:DNA-binding beta-propeller fold protein YncE
MQTFARAVLGAAIACAASGALAEPLIDLNQRWTYETGIFDDSAAEIVAYDPVTRQVYVVNGAESRIDVLNAATGAFVTSLTSFSGFGVPNSVAVKNGVIAVAVENGTNKQQSGRVYFYDTASGTEQSVATVGALPDMVTFTPDGSKVLVANEGEPNSYNQPDSVDPEGSVSVVDIANIAAPSVTTIGFTDFNVGGSRNGELPGDVRIFGPNASVAQDLEPEYITVSPDGSKAYVSLQENNAIAEVDLASNSITAIRALGFKDHSAAGNALDASNRDGAINIQNWPVLGMYQPDAIASYEVGGMTYIVTANEGDARDYTGFGEEARVKDLDLDSSVFTDALLQEDENLGRLKVTTTLGNTDADDEFEALYSFGARSFSIWDETGALVFDSGDQFEQIIAGLGLLDSVGNPVFNANNDDQISFDSRSDDKGPEPEAVAIGQIYGMTLAFIGLERIGGIMIYDITDPTNPAFMNYILGRDFSEDDAESPAAGDLGPEGIYFVHKDLSPFGSFGLIVANEVSGTTTWYDIQAQVPAPASLALFAAGLPLLVLRRRRR